MAPGKKNIPDWFDPLGIRGSILDPLAALNEAAKVVAPVTQPFAWMMTAAARRLHGRRVRIESTPQIKARVARIDEISPATAISVPGLSDSIALWRRAVFSVDQVWIERNPIDRVDVVASDIRVRDSSARQVLISGVKLVATLTAESVASWMNSLGIDGVPDFDSGNIEIHPVSRLRWLRVAAEPSILPRGAEVRALSVAVGPLSLPIPKWLLRTRTVSFPHLPEELALTGLSMSDGQVMKVMLEGKGIDIPVDMPRLMAEIGVEGTMSVVDILRP